jgi:hypothetical protein
MEPLLNYNIYNIYNIFPGIPSLNGCHMLPSKLSKHSTNFNQKKKTTDAGPLILGATMQKGVMPPGFETQPPPSQPSLLHRQNDHAVRLIPQGPHTEASCVTGDCGCPG